MHVLLNQISSSILDHQLFQRSEKILVGVSGGLDSVVLLHVLKSLSAEWGWDLTVAHLNHRLRGRSSAGDARFVEKLSRRLGIRFCGSVAEVRTIARRDCISLEMAGRQARHVFFKQAALDNNCSSVALAHHADDQVELFFLRLLRGGGEGLGGMRGIGALPNHPQIRLVRPLLNLSKSVLKDYAATVGLSFREDASNADLNFQRNRVRHELLPLLRKSYQAGLDSVVTRTMDILSAEADCVGDLARQWIQARQPDFGSLPVAVQRRALQTQLFAVGIIPDFSQIEGLRSAPHQAVNLSQAQRPLNAPERSVARDGAGMIYFPTPPAEAPVEPEVEVPVELGVRGNMILGKASLEWRVETRRGLGVVLQRRAGRMSEYFDADKVGGRITLRHWRPGDRFCPIGMLKSVKLQDLLTNAKIPRNQRHTLLLGTTERGEIFWVEGLRISEQFKLTSQTRRRLMWQWKRI